MSSSYWNPRAHLGYSIFLRFAFTLGPEFADSWQLYGALLWAGPLVLLPSFPRLIYLKLCRKFKTFVILTRRTVGWKSIRNTWLTHYIYIDRYFWVIEDRRFQLIFWNTSRESAGRCVKHFLHKDFEFAWQNRTGRKVPELPRHLQA